VKRSHEPVFWSLFGAGGILAALCGFALVFVTGIGAPLGWIVSPRLMEFDNMQAFASGASGKLVIFAFIVLLLWHAVLRMLLLLRDFGIGGGFATRLGGYGLTLLATLLTAYLLLAPGS
jgi:fumarate reductase subunit D